MPRSLPVGPLIWHYRRTCLVCAVAQDDVISEIYDLVTAPDEYDAFMLRLEQKLTDMHQRDEDEAARSFAAHVQRASALLDLVKPWRRATNAALHQELTR